MRVRHGGSILMVIVVTEADDKRGNQNGQAM